MVITVAFALAGCGDDDGVTSGTESTTTIVSSAGAGDGPCALLGNDDIESALEIEVVSATPGDAGGVLTCSYVLDAPETFVIVFLDEDVPPGQEPGAGLDEVRDVDVEGASAAAVGVQPLGTGGDQIVAVVDTTAVTISVGPIGTADEDALVALAASAVARL